MSAYTTWISPKGIMQDVLDATGYEGKLNDELVSIATNKTIDKILTGDNHKEYIVLLPLYNYKAGLPANFRFPTQVAYRANLPTFDPPEVIKKYFVSSMSSNKAVDIRVNACETCKKEICGCETKQWFPIAVDANYVQLTKTPLLATGYSDFMYGCTNSYHNNHTVETGHFEPENTGAPLYHNKKGSTVIGLQKRFSRPKKCPQFQMVRPTSNYFFNLPGSLKACNVPSYDTNLEYRIEDGVIELNNFKSYNCNNCSSCIQEKQNNHPSDYQSQGACEYNYEPEKDGHILISYLGRRMDDEGWLMIPNEEYVASAVTDGVIEFLARRRYSITKEQKDRHYWIAMKQEAFKSVTQARSRLRISTYDKWEQFVENHWTKRIPYRNYKNLNNASVQDEYRLPNESYIDKSSTYLDSFYKGFYQ